MSSSRSDAPRINPPTDDIGTEEIKVEPTSATFVACGPWTVCGIEVSDSLSHS